MYDKLFSPFRIGGLSLKNRIVFAPTTLGLPEEQLIAFIARVARGGAGLIVLGDVSARSAPLSLYSRRGFDRYRRLCDAAHAGGAKVCAQLHLTDSSFRPLLKYLPQMLTRKIGPQDMRVLLNGTVRDTVTRMPPKDVERNIRSFGEAAALAQRAGFDMVQVHGDRMCGSFSSSLYNQREDGYGGSPENRARFCVEAVRAVRASVPDMPIDYKLAIRQESPHYGNAGVLIDELPVFVPMLTEAGVSSFHVALANHGALSDPIPPADHPYFQDEGCFLGYCDAVRRYTRLPICGVGGLSSPDFIEAQLAVGRIDLVAMSRQLICDPEWPVKVAEGLPYRRCIRCNKGCLEGLQRHQGAHCIFERE